MNKQSKLEIVSRNVDFPGNGLLSFPYQHLFLLYTKEGETPVSVSAGPEVGNYLTGNINVVLEDYKDDIRNKDFERCKKGKCLSAIQIEGDDSIVSAKWAKILERREAINEAKVDYDNALICESVVNGFQILGQGIDRIMEESFTTELYPPYLMGTGLCNTINSNMVVKELLSHAEVPMQLPIHDGGTPIDLPGIQGTFDKEKLDKSWKDLLESRDAALKSAQFNSFDVIDAKKPQRPGTPYQPNWPHEDNGGLQRALEEADKAIEAQKQMHKEGVKIKASTGDYTQDVMDIIEYTNELLRRASSMPGETEKNDEL